MTKGIMGGSSNHRRSACSKFTVFQRDGSRTMNICLHVLKETAKVIRGAFCEGFLLKCIDYIPEDLSTLAPRTLLDQIP